jgi:uncharacterized protein (TIGR04255 family)
MPARPTFTIDLEEDFPRLARPPIVEAVIHWRAPAAKPLKDSTVLKALQQRFDDYKWQEQQEVGAAFQAQPGNVEIRQQTQWNGYRLTRQSETDRYVAQFTPHGVIFSRLAQYDCWATFEVEALRFWQAYVDLAEPPIIDRLGVRFINQIRLAPTDTLASFLRHPPSPPPDLRLDSDHFFHQDAYGVSGHPYHVNSVRTLQTLPDQERALILDTDVSLEPKSLLTSEVLSRRLAEMRYIKNKLFFAYMTEDALDQFGRDDNG